MSSSIPTKYRDTQKKHLEKQLDGDDYILEKHSKTSEERAIEGINWLWETFDRKIHTFQFISESKRPVKTFSKRENALASCLKYNAAGYDIFFMVNEGDGIVHPPKQTPRSQASVKSLSACFIDTDNCDIQKVNEYLDSLPLAPHATIESSPGRFHMYFLLTETSLEHTEQWQQIQHILHRLGDPAISPKDIGMDSTMHDYSKLLRVPGFRHIKKSCFVEIKSVNDLPRCDLAELYELTNADTFTAPVISHVPDLSNPTHIDIGDRFATLQSLALSLANDRSQSLTEHWKTYSEYIRTNIDNEDGAYYNGKGPTNKATALFNSAFKKIEHEQNVTLSTDQTPKSESFELPDSFYLSAPNGFGDVVRQVMDHSLYPCAALAFGTFLTGLSILKAKSFFTAKGSSPALYTLNIAPTGFGKNAPMALLQNTLVANGLGSLIANEVRSDRGLYNHLASNQGMGILILDEVAPLLKSIQQKTASSHLANISKAFLHLYSAAALKGVSLGKLTNSNTKKGEPEIVIDNPTIAICGFTVPSQFFSMFNADSVAEGLFQRFIPIVAEIKLVEENDNADSHAIIKSDLFQRTVDAEEIDDEGNVVPPLCANTRTRMPYTGEAAARFKALQREYREKLITSAQDQTQEHMSGLYSRLAEQVERVATVLSIDAVDLPTLEYAIRFLESRHKAVMAVAEGSIVGGRGAESMQLEKALVEATARICTASGEKSVTMRDLFNRVRRHFKDYKHFEQGVRDARESGALQAKEVKTKNGKQTLQINLGGVIFD